MNVTNCEQCNGWPIRHQAASHSQQRIKSSHKRLTAFCGIELPRLGPASFIVLFSWRPLRYRELLEKIARPKSEQFVYLCISLNFSVVFIVDKILMRKYSHATLCKGPFQSWPHATTYTLMPSSNISLTAPYYLFIFRLRNSINLFKMKHIKSTPSKNT